MTFISQYSTGTNLRSLHNQPLKYGFSLPAFLNRMIRRDMRRLTENLAYVVIDLCDYIIDFPHLYKLGPHLLARLAKDPIFKGRYILVSTVRNFAYLPIRLLITTEKLC